MTCRTTRQLLNFVFPDQFSAERELIRGRQIIHAEHVLSGADEAFRFTVTLEAPVHVKSVFTPHERHLIDPAMTSGTADTLVDMNAMVEIDKAREIVDSGPLNRLSRTKTFPDGFQDRTVSPNLGVAIHAGFCRRDAGERTFLDRRMAVATIDAIVTDMMLMTEGYRLAASDADFRDVR